MKKRLAALMAVICLGCTTGIATKASETDSMLPMSTEEETLSGISDAETLVQEDTEIVGAAEQAEETSKQDENFSAEQVSVQEKMTDKVIGDTEKMEETSGNDTEEFIAEGQIQETGELQEETEEKSAGKDFQSASWISMGQTLSGSITGTSQSDQIQMYQFSLNTSGRVTLNFHSEMQYYQAIIYDNEGKEVWRTQNNEWNTNLKYREDIHNIDLTNGHFYLKITGFNYSNSSNDYGYGASTGTYRFSTSFVSANESCGEFNNDFSHASVIATDGTYNGQIAENDGYDIYRFSVTQPGRIKFTMTSYTQYYRMYIYDNTGNLLWDSEGKEWNSNLKYRTDIYDLDFEGGSYYLKVTGQAYTWSETYKSTGNYTFSMNYFSAGVNYTEPNNDFSTAFILSPNTTIQGHIAFDDRYDIFRFSLTEEEEVNFHITSYMKYYTFHIYDAGGEEIWNSSDNEWNENVGYRHDDYVKVLSAGSYYLKVTGYRNGESDASTGNYTLSYDTYLNLNKVSIKDIKNQQYTGKAITPSIKVTYNDRSLKKGADYKVSYSNNKKIGKAKITITGIGECVGSKTASFSIVPKKVKISSAKNNKKGTVTVKWKRDSNVTGYEIYNAVNYKNGYYSKIKTVRRNKTISCSCKNFSRGRTYYIKVRAYKSVNGKKYYGAFSTPKKVKIRK